MCEVTRSHQETYDTYDPLDNMGRGKKGKGVNTVYEKHWVQVPWVRTPVSFPELIFISVDTRGLVDDAHWGRWTIYEVGTFSYPSLSGALKTIKKYTANPQEVIDVVKGNRAPSPNSAVAQSVPPLPNRLQSEYARYNPTDRRQNTVTEFTFASISR
jgi:hypothetical protein